jgi:hypothetical protein
MTLLFMDGPLGHGGVAHPFFSPMAAKVTKRLWDIGDIVGVLEARGRPSEEVLSGRKAMEWFSRKTSIAGTQISNWILVLAALAVIWIIYSSVAH